MTDRPTLADLDAEPEPTRWCCGGNAEGCPLCTGTPPYPWSCPGHPATEENRARVRAAAEAAKPAAWTQLEARAFNAVLPALREAGEWLPLSARRAVARAVLTAVQPHIDTECRAQFDAAIQALGKAETELAQLRARVRQEQP